MQKPPNGAIRLFSTDKLYAVAYFAFWYLFWIGGNVQEWHAIQKLHKKREILIQTSLAIYLYSIQQIVLYDLYSNV